jgi:hypothetical protein
MEFSGAALHHSLSSRRAVKSRQATTQEEEHAPAYGSFESHLTQGRGAG